MAKNNVFDYAKLAADNEDIATINVSGTGKVKDGDNAIRTLMAHTAENIVARGSDIASASTLDLDAATTPSLLHDVTGTTTTTAITLTEGQWRIVRAAGAWPLTASSSLIINGSTAVSYTCAADDLLLVEGYSSSVVRVWIINTKGAGMLTPASASGPASLALAEDTDNGSNKITLTVPASISSDISVTLPTVAGTLTTGPTSTTDNTLARYDGTGGGIQTSGVVVDDSGNMSGVPVLTVSQGVKLPATQNPSSDANVFDDYEEGTWVSSGIAASSGSFSNASASGSYTKKGREVTLRGDLAIIAIFSASGIFTMAGNPFTPSGNASGSCTNINAGQVGVCWAVGGGGNVQVWRDGFASMAAGNHTINFTVTYHV